MVLTFFTAVNLGTGVTDLHTNKHIINVFLVIIINLLIVRGTVNVNVTDLLKLSPLVKLLTNSVALSNNRNANTT